MLRTELIPALSNNYIFLLHDDASGATAVVDPAEAEPVLTVLAQRGWKLSHIFNTHHHGDHVGGNLTLKRATGCDVVAPEKDRHRIPSIDRTVKEGDVVALGTRRARVMEVPGHTTGHIAYYFADDDALFCGDTLFLMGCGRLFEGTPEMMWASLAKIAALPNATRVYCAHELTLSNAKFAAAQEPQNQALQAHLQAIAAKRSRGECTVPGNLGEEKRLNPFLRASNASAFAELRRRKDVF